MTSVMWDPHEQPGADRAVIERTSQGHRIAGTSLLVVDGVAHEIRYTILTDDAWRTRTVGAHVQGSGQDRRLALHCDGEGTWSVGDEPILDLFGATDIDLAWTPATNTLPIRRLQLEIGETAEVVVAYIAFPQHDVGRRRQRYTRMDATTYRYESAGRAIDIGVDDGGIVVDYPGGWRAVSVD